MPQQRSPSARHSPKRRSRSASRKRTQRGKRSTARRTDIRQCQRVGDELCKDGTLKNRFRINRKAPQALAKNVSPNKTYPGVDGGKWHAPKGHWKRVPRGAGKHSAVNPTNPHHLVHTDCTEAPHSNQAYHELVDIAYTVAKGISNMTRGAKDQLYRRAEAAYHRYHRHCTVSSDIHDAHRILSKIHSALY